MRRMRGFTLLEVLLATLLLASAIAVTAASVQGMSRAQARGEALLAENTERNAVLRLLRARIAAALPARFDRGDGTRVMFIGSATRMEFVTEMPAYATFGGPMRQLIERQAGTRGHLLCIAHGPRAGTTLRCAPGAQTTLADGLAGAEFRYRGRDDGGLPGAWQQEWTQPERLPEWIQVRLASTAGQREWPLLEVRLPLAPGITQ